MKETNDVFDDTEPRVFSSKDEIVYFAFQSDRTL